MFKSSMVMGLLAAPLAVAISGVPGAAAASQGTVTEMTNTETIQARLDATGKVTEARVYEQIAVNGDGQVEIVNPVSTNGLRNLDGFGGFKIEGDSMVASVDVQGRKRLRTVSDYKKDLPLGVEVKYELNGNEIDPKKVVGASGDLKVTYTVKNLTATKQSVSFDDGTGKKLSEEMDVVIPMVGSLTTVLPAKFTEVQSEQANMAGDGRGGTKLSFTMTLFPPIGTDTAEFGYTAKIRDGVVPPASISALPVQPLQSPSFKGGAESFAGGADTGAQLTAGAVEIDSNLLKLRDGASELLAGLVQLRDGAEQLRAGLQGEAAPGARELASGASQASSGAGELAAGTKRLDKGASDLASGAGELDAGADKLAAGAATAAAGSATLAAGVERLSGGIDQLANVKGLPAMAAGLQELRYAIDHPIGAQGPSDPGGLLQGLRQVQAGLNNPKCDPKNPTNPANPCGVSQGLAALAAGLPDATAALDGLITPGLNDIKSNIDGLMLPGVGEMRDGFGEALKTGGDIDKLAGGVAMAEASDGCQSDPACQGILDQVAAGVATLREKTQEADTGAAKIQGGLQQMSAGAGELSGGTEQVSDGIKTAIAGVNALQAGVNGKLIPGVNAIEGGVETRLLDGVDQLLAGVNKAVAGILQLSDGGHQAAGGANQLAQGLPTLSSGAKQLSDGTGKLKAGAGQLADGTGQLNAGAGKLADGNKKIADGAGQLADGLGDAADGSGQLADGLVQAADGAPQIVDGAQRLSDEGMGPLTDAGMNTAQEFGSKYALIEAVNERAANEGMAFGAPEGANGLTAYSLEISGEDGEGGRNMARGLGALAVFGLGSGLVVGVRNRLF